jgi:tetratricopeptide (TPR) repeat protein
VAIKVVRDELAAAVGADRFLREITITSRLSHPHIRPLLDSGEIDGVLYYAMPFNPGETLRDRLKRENRLSLDESLRIARDLADALDYAHSESIVHRDVKPGNVFLDAGNAVLSDFGIAMAVELADSERLTDSGVVVGTPEYLSPEQCDSSNRVDGRSDIYSLGCVLYEMLTGQPPFTGRTRAAVIAKHISEPAPSAAVLRPDLPVEVEELLQKCLAKTPGDRWSKAGLLRDAIDEAVALVRTGASRGVATATRRRTRRRVRLALMALAPAFVAAAVLWSVAESNAPPLDTNRVMIFPLANRGGGGDAGSAVAMMIGNTLIQADPLRPIDAWDYLTADQRTDPMTHLSWTDAREVARSHGAAWAIMGGVTHTRDSTSVRLTLHDVHGNDPVADGSFTGATSEMGAEQIGVRALVELLPALGDPGRQVDVTALMDRDPAAIFLWIRGDLEYRSARFSAALELYRAAVHQDSLLVFAALKGAQAASWAERPELAAELARHAVASKDVLPARFGRFADGLLHYFEGRADEAVAAFRRALADDPEWAEAWMALGEVYQHLFPLDLDRGVFSAADAFENATRYDSTFAPPLVHLSEHAIREGNVDRAAELIDRLQESGAEGAARLAATALFIDCAGSRPDSTTWTDAARRDYLTVLEAAHQLAVGGAFLDCAEAGFRAALETAELPAVWRWHALLGLQSVLIAEARDEEARALLDEAVAAGVSTALFLPPLDVQAGAAMHEAAQRVDSFADSLFGPSWDRAGPVTLWVIGAWRAHQGDTATLAPIRQQLRLLARDTSNQHAVLTARAIEARWLLLAGDTAGAIEQLQGLRVIGTRSQLLTSMDNAYPGERLLLAELLLSRGEPEPAYWAAAVLDHHQPLLFTAFVPRSLAIRYAAASRLTGSAWRQRTDSARLRLEAMGRADLIPTAVNREGATP